MHNTEEGVTSESPTEQADTTTDAAESPPSAPTGRENFLADGLAKAKEGDAKPVDAKTGKADGQKAKPADEKKADGAEVPGDKKEDDEKPWPAKAAKARLGKEVAKRKQAEEKLHDTQGEVQRLHAALKLQSEELERYRQSLESGSKYDPKDEQLRAYELSQKAQQEAQRIAHEQQAALQKQVQEMQVVELREQLAEEIEGALGQFGKLVHRHELIEAMQADPNVSAEAAAKAIFDGKLAAARPHLLKQPPATPRTMRATAGGNTRRDYSLDSEGLLSRFMELASENR